MMKAILVTKADHVRLLEVVDAERQVSGTRVIGLLSSELHRAIQVDSAAIPADIITMNSVVRLRELTSQTALEITLVYPKEADVARRKISILAPVATAVLGRQVGDNVTWPVPKGLATYQIEALLHQPEAATGQANIVAR